MLRNPKFKISDRVRILRVSTNTERCLWGDDWCLWMDRNIGQVLVVNDLRNWGSSYKYYKYHLDGYWYPEFVLEKEIQIGQQLLFEFMTP